MPNSTLKIGPSGLVKSLVISVVKCGKEAGKVPVLRGEGSLRRIFFLEIFDDERGIR